MPWTIIKKPLANIVSSSLYLLTLPYLVDMKSLLKSRLSLVPWVKLQRSREKSHDNAPSITWSQRVPVNGIQQHSLGAFYCHLNANQTLNRVQTYAYLECVYEVLYILYLASSHIHQPLLRIHLKSGSKAK